jgi:hypothetical protein
VDFDEWMDRGWLEGEKKYVYPTGYKMVDLSCDTTQRSPFQGLQNFGRLWHIIPQILLEATSCSSCVSNPFFLPCTSHFSCRKSYIFIGQRTSHGNCSGLSLAVELFLFCTKNAKLIDNDKAITTKSLDINVQTLRFQLPLCCKLQ